MASASQQPPERSYVAKCCCGKICLQMSGPPIFSAVCHCSKCRRAHAATHVNNIGWLPDKVKIEGKEQYGKAFKSSDYLSRWYCGECGTRICNENSRGRAFIATFASIIHSADEANDENFSFPSELVPTFHIFYENAISPWKDGLPKFKTMPQYAGGSGEQLPE